jgi:hypothetical protein
LPIFVDVSVERGFQSKAIHDIKLLPKNDPGSLKLRFLNPEFAGVKAEHVCALRQKLGENAHLEISLIVKWEMWAIDKD